MTRRAITPGERAVRVDVRLPVAAVDRLRTLAADRGTSVSEVARALLVQALADLEVLF